jgi:hypothetical protein
MNGAGFRAAALLFRWRLMPPQAALCRSHNIEAFVAGHPRNRVA